MKTLTAPKPFHGRVQPGPDAGNYLGRSKSASDSFARQLDELADKLTPKIDRLIEATFAQHKRTVPTKSVAERAAEKGLSVDQQLALDDPAHAKHILAYFDDRNRHARSGIGLADYVFSSLLDDGTIAGHEFGCDTFGRYSDTLQSALQKIESQLPAVPSNPLLI